MVLGTLAADWAAEIVRVRVQWTDLTHWDSLTEPNSIYNPRPISLRGELSSLTAHCMERGREGGRRGSERRNSKKERKIGTKERKERDS